MLEKPLGSRHGGVLVAPVYSLKVSQHGIKRNRSPKAAIPTGEADNNIILHNSILYNNPCLVFKERQAGITS